MFHFINMVKLWLGYWQVEYVYVFSVKNDLSHTIQPIKSAAEI